MLEIIQGLSSKTGSSKLKTPPDDSRHQLPTFNFQLPTSNFRNSSTHFNSQAKIKIFPPILIDLATIFTSPLKSQKTPALHKDSNDNGDVQMKTYTLFISHSWEQTNTPPLITGEHGIEALRIAELVKAEIKASVELAA